MALLTVEIVSSDGFTELWEAREVSDWAHASVEIPSMLTGCIEEGEMYRVTDAWDRLEDKHAARPELPVICEVDITDAYDQHTAFFVNVECRIVFVSNELYALGGC